MEVGTGAGVGTAWIVEGVGRRSHVEVVTVDNDAQLSARIAAEGWPPWVRFEVGDALQVVPLLGQFNLVFADAVAGKWYGLDVTIDATAPGGIIVVDDMTPSRWADEEHELRTQEVRTRLVSDARLAVVEMGWGSGVIMSTRRAT